MVTRVERILGEVQRAHFCVLVEREMLVYIPANFDNPLFDKAGIRWKGMERYRTPINHILFGVA